MAGGGGGGLWGRGLLANNFSETACLSSEASLTTTAHWVSRFGPVVRRWAGKQRDLGPNPLRLSFLFKSCSLWTPSCDFVPHS